MESSQFIDNLMQLGPVIVIIILYLEGLNLTGIPAVVIMPAVGIYISQNDKKFIVWFLIAVISTMLGNLTYYFVSCKIGSLIYDKLYTKFSGLRKALDKANELSEKYGAKACFIARLIPGARSFVSLISGILKVKFKDFFIYSLAGIVIWNFVFTSIGYLIGNLY